MFSDQSEIKLMDNYKKVTRKSPKCLEIKQHFLNTYEEEKKLQGK